MTLSTPTALLPRNCPDPTRIAPRLLAAEPALRSSGDFGAGVHQGCAAGPAIIIGDQSVIPLFARASQSRLDYRMAWLAQDGDAVIVQHRDHRFERYLTALLGLEQVNFVSGDSHLPLSVSQEAQTAGPLHDALVQYAAQRGAVTLKPYLTTGHTWLLARRLWQQTGAEISVCGPTPRTVRRANDKLWFTTLVHALLGQDATPPTLSAFGPAAAAGLVAYLAQRAETVVVKVPDSAGAVGNITLSAQRLRGHSLTYIRQLLVTRLHARGWQDRYPVLVGVWDGAVSHSPSAHIWLPLPNEGPPSFQGLFEQHVRDGFGAFVGARRAELRASLRDRLTQEALCIAGLLQQIGYYGQCSFDAVICQGETANPQVHWIECNGRWGGVSLPLQLAARICPQDPPEGLLIVQETRRDLRAVTTDDYLAALADVLAGPDHPADGIIVMSPPQANRGVMLNWLVLAPTQTIAAARAKTAMTRLQARFGR